MTTDSKTTNDTENSDAGPGLDRKAARERMRWQRREPVWRERAERAQQRYDEARAALAEVLVKASGSPADAGETCDRVADDLRKGLPRKPGRPADDGDVIEAMRAVASLAPERVVDAQSASHVAMLHARVVAALEFSDHWRKQMWQQAFHLGQPGWLGHAFKPLAESVRCMRAHADIAGKLERRQHARDKSAEGGTTRPSSGAPTVDRAAIEEALARSGAKRR